MSSDNGGPWELPQGWVWATFVEVAHVAGNLVSPLEYPDLPHIAPNHIESETGRLLPFSTVAEDGVKSPKHLFSEGHILYSKIRPYLAKVVVARFDGLCSADMYPVSTELDPGYLALWLCSPAFTSFAARHQGRSVLPKINKEALAKLPVPVPPLMEQQRIVAVLEEQLSRIAAGVILLESAEKRLSGLKLKIGDAKTSPVGDVYGEGRWVSFGDLIESARGGWSRSRAHLVSAEEGTPYFKMNNISSSGLLDMTQIAHVATDEESLGKYLIREGDVLFNNKNSQELVGKTALADRRISGWVFNENISRIRLVDEVLPEFAVLQMNSVQFRKEISKMRSASTNVAAIYTRDLKRAPFWLPSIRVQRKLVDDYADFCGKTDHLHPAITASKARGQALRRSLLAEAFAGRLIPQNPADEPAGVLLARIRAEREATGVTKSQRRTPGRAPTQRKRRPAPAPDAPSPRADALKFATATQPTLDLEIPS
ncbi:restriction endonuclease subunit S [Streptomyces hirsutus]|uniref:restriction endonuclease subunit S n=1 Tax=Streptomyces hirsutus TaxID=35620 RepID=UPI0036B1448A